MRLLMVNVGGIIRFVLIWSLNVQNTQSTKIKRKPTQKKSNTKSEGTSPGENNTKEVQLCESSSGNVKKIGSSSGNGKKSGSLQINGSSVAERTFQHFAGCHVSGDYTLPGLGSISIYGSVLWKIYEADSVYIFHFCFNSKSKFC